MFPAMATYVLYECIEIVVVVYIEIIYAFPGHFMHYMCYDMGSTLAEGFNKPQITFYD
jgi:hypothetical protein